MLNASKRIKENRFKRSKYHIPYYTASHFNSGKEDEDGEKANIALSRFQ